MRGKAVNSFVLQMSRFVTARSTVGESSSAEPVCKPGHVAVAVEGVGDEVERGHAGQLVKGPRGHTADHVAIQ